MAALFSACVAEPLLPAEQAFALTTMPPFPGIVLFRAVDEAEARQIMERDPAVKAGVFQTCLLPFTASFESH